MLSDKQRGKSEARKIRGDFCLGPIKYYEGIHRDWRLSQKKSNEKNRSHFRRHLQCTIRLERKQATTIVYLCCSIAFH